MYSTHYTTAEETLKGRYMTKTKLWQRLKSVTPSNAMASFSLNQSISMLNISRVRIPSHTNE